jgi:hypothetical protein
VVRKCSVALRLSPLWKIAPGYAGLASDGEKTNPFARANRSILSQRPQRPPPEMTTRTIAKPTSPRPPTKSSRKMTAIGLPSCSPFSRKNTMPPSIGANTAAPTTATTTPTTMFCTDMLAQDTPEARACARYADTSCGVGVVSSGE